MAETIYSLEQVSEWQTELKDFAQTPRTSFTKRQAVEAMIDEIEAALENHPYHEVAEKLKGLGLTISKGLLKQYVNAYRREHTPEKIESHKPSGKRSSRQSNRANKQAKQPKKTTALTKDIEQSKQGENSSPSIAVTKDIAQLKRSNHPPSSIAVTKDIAQFEADNYPSDQSDIPRRKKSSSRFIEMPEEL